MGHSLKCRLLRAAEPFVFSAGRTPGRRMVGVSAGHHESRLMPIGTSPANPGIGGETPLPWGDENSRNDPR